MDKTFTAKKTKLLQQMQCSICLGGVKDALLCPYCSQFYCKKCINNWLTSKFTSCPNCRKTIREDSLVEGRSINEVQQSIAQLMDCMERNLCDEHKQHLTLYCYCCEANICVRCWFLPEHLDHKERVVPLDDAHEHYRQTLKSALVWANGQKDLIYEGQKKVTNIQKELDSEYDYIEELCDNATELVAGEASPTALTKILKTVGEIKELRSKRQRDIEAIRIDRHGDFMPEPTVLVFCIPELKKQKWHELTVTDPNGFVWKCSIQEAETDEEKDDGGSLEEEKDIEESGEQEINYHCCLSLLEGKSSEYSVTFDHQPEKVLLFGLTKDVFIGSFKPEVDTENDTCRVTFEIRQTYTDRIQQLEGRIAQLEKQCDEQKSFKSFISAYEKSMGVSSG